MKIVKGLKRFEDLRIIRLHDLKIVKGLKKGWRVKERKQMMTKFIIYIVAEHRDVNDMAVWREIKNPNSSYLIVS